MHIGEYLAVKTKQNAEKVKCAAKLLLCLDATAENYISSRPDTKIKTEDKLDY